MVKQWIDVYKRQVYNSVITENMEISENIGDKNSTSVYLVSEDGIEEE